MRLAIVVVAALGACCLHAAVDGTRASGVDFDCSDFVNQAEAQEHLLPGDPYHLDGDGDGIACEALPCPCSPVAGGGGEGGGGNPPHVPDPQTPAPQVPAGNRLRAQVVRDVDGDTLDAQF